MSGHNSIHCTASHTHSRQSQHLSSLTIAHTDTESYSSQMIKQIHRSLKHLLVLAKMRIQSYFNTIELRPVILSTIQSLQHLIKTDIITLIGSELFSHILSYCDSKTMKQTCIVSWNKRSLLLSFLAEQNNEQKTLTGIDRAQKMRNAKSLKAIKR